MKWSMWPGCLSSGGIIEYHWIIHNIVGATVKNEQVNFRLWQDDMDPHAFLARYMHLYSNNLNG